MVRGARDVNPRLVVYAAALLAALFRFPGLLYPLGSDEAGFTLVARAWDPQPDSLYGTYWVDRPPSLIALIRLSDWIGGPLLHPAARGRSRSVALVILAAGTARARAAVRRRDRRAVRQPHRRLDRRTGGGVHVDVDDRPDHGQGRDPRDPVRDRQLLPGRCGRSPGSGSAPGRRSWRSGPGLTAVLAQGMKQNLVAGPGVRGRAADRRAAVAPDHPARVPPARRSRPWPARRCPCSRRSGGRRTRASGSHDALVRRVRLPLRRDRRDRHRRRATAR